LPARNNGETCICLQQSGENFIGILTRSAGLTFYQVVAFGIVGSILVGYDQGVIGSTLGQVSWYNQLGLPMSPEEPGYNHTITIESASNGVYFASCVFGALAIGVVMNLFGRIRAFQFSIFWQILGSVLLTASMNQPMFLVSRVVIGFATGCNASLGPTFVIH
jgi:MFS family permease